jgi:flavin-dependent dehydrogenase
MTHDVMIIGGGPAGATAAALLAKAGWSVAVLEKAAFPRRKVCGEFISATTLPLLHEIGVGEAFSNFAGPDVRRVGLFARDMTLNAPLPQPAGLTLGWGRALGREHLDLLLLDAAARAGARVWQPWSAIELYRSKTGYICRAASTGKGTTELAARMVVISHGSWGHSLLPLKPKAHEDFDLLAFKAHFRDCDLPSDLMPLLIFRGGYGGMVHSDNGRVSLSCCIRRDELRRCRRRWPHQHAGDSVLQNIQNSCLGVRQTLRRATLDGAWLSAGPIRPGIRSRYSNGIFLAGNIAGEAHPLIAEGISMAMQAAQLLAQRLIAQQNDLTPDTLSAVGEEYSAEWKACFEMRVRAAAVFAYLASRPAIIALVLPLIARFPTILTFGARLSGKAQIHAPHV